MSDAQTALAQVREALAARPTPGPWSWWTSCSFRRLSSDATCRDGDVLHATIHRDGMGDIVGSEATKQFIAACNPVNIAAILAHVDAQAAEIERLTFDNEQLRDMLARLYAGSALYSDDGELQDARADPFIDFKRDAVADIRCAMVERGEQR